MTQAPVAALVVALTLAAVLLTSAVAKLRDSRATRDAFTALRVPAVVPADLAAPALPWLELALAVLLVVAPAAGLVAVAALVLLLMLAYTALVGRALGFDEPVTCSCFGSIGRHDVDRTTLARNVLLTAMAAVVLWFAVDGGSVPSALGGLDSGGWAALAATLAAAVVAVLVLGGSAPTPQGSDDLLDYERQPIPYGALTLSDGTGTSIAQLAAMQARLLVVLNPGCGPCVRTAEKLDGWAEGLAPAVGVVAIYPDEASAHAAGEHAPDLAAWEPELNVRRVFSVSAPAAILLGADGALAGGPVAGEDEVAGFVDEVLGVLAEQESPAE